MHLYNLDFLRVAFALIIVAFIFCLSTVLKLLFLIMNLGLYATDFLFYPVCL